MFKQIISFLSYFVLLSFAGALFSSFALENNWIAEISTINVQEFFLENWAFIGLVLSEIAALLPGKPKGIIHAIVKILNNVYSKSTVKSQNSQS